MKLYAEEGASFFPLEPVAFIFVMMIMMLQGRHLTDEAAQIVMLFLNMALNHLELEYRFPKKLSTFIARMDYQGRFYNGITQYISCKDCHHIHELPNEQEERKTNRYCRRVTKYNSVGIAITWCNVDLYRVTKKGKLIPQRIYLYNSVIATIKKFRGFSAEKQIMMLRISVASELISSKQWTTRSNTVHHQSTGRLQRPLVT